MEISSVQKKIAWTAEDRARHKAIRDKYQKERPTLEQLVASGDLEAPIPMGAYLEFRILLHDLRVAREEAGLSLANVAERSGIDQAALSRLENGSQTTPTANTLMRYAAALGKQLTWSLTDLPTGAPRDRNETP